MKIKESSNEAQDIDSDLIMVGMVGIVFIAFHDSHPFSLSFPHLHILSES